MLAAAVAGVWQREANEAMVLDQLQRHGEHAAEQLRRLVMSYESGLLGVRGHLIAAGGGSAAVSWEEFHHYVAALDLPHRFPGARGFGFIRRVAAGQEMAFLAQARRDGMPALRIQELGPNPGEHFVIQYLEPVPGNAEALGLDIASEADRRQTALAALRSGEPRLTPPITLAQARSQPERSTLLLLPLYRGFALPAPDRRETEGLGWVFAPLVMEEVLHSFGKEDSTLAMALTDNTVPGAPRRFYTSQTWRSMPEALVRGVPLQVFGRAWQVDVQAAPTFEASLNLRSPGAVAAVVAVTGALLSLVLYLAMRPAARARLIRYERAQMAAMVASAHDAIIRHTLDGRILSWNAAAERLLGWCADEVRGRSLTELTVPPHLRDEAQQLHERVQRGEDVAPLDTVRLDRHGTAVDVSLSVVPIRQGDGRMNGAATTLRDIRAQRAAQARILELNASLQQQVQQVQQRTAEVQALAARERTIVSSAGSAIIVIDLQHRITLFNTAAERLTGYSAAQALGQPAAGLLFDLQDLRERHRALQAALGRALEADEVHMSNSLISLDGEWHLRRSDGTRVPVLLKVRPLRDQHSRIDGLIYVAVDISERKRLEQELELRTRQAEAANQAKTTFLANMSHEIRTPLNAVIGLGHLLERTTLDERQQRFVHNINVAGEQLFGLVSDILDVSKIEAGELHLEVQPFDLPNLLQQVRAITEDLAAQKKLQTGFAMDEGVPRQVCGDAARIKQVLTNLLSNAVKFTEAGSVMLRVRQMPLTAPAGPDLEPRVSLRFEVTDTGIGIPPDKQATIFQPFTQADASTTRRFGGTGLGLSIVRKLVDLMDGRLEVHSMPGQGSTFSVTLTLALPRR